MQRQPSRPYVWGLMLSSVLYGTDLFLTPPLTSADFVAEAQSQHLPSLADVTWTGSEVSFVPRDAGISVRLRVTGPDYVYEESSDGDALLFQALEDDGGVLPDGTYRYELVELAQLDVDQADALAESRDPEEARALKRQWRRAGLWPLPQPRVQQAVFHIEHGEIIAPQ